MANEAITLSPDASVVALREIQKIQEAVGTLAGVLQRKGTLDTELTMSCLKVAEFQLADLCRTLGIETEGSREMEARYADIRAANARVRALEQRLGDVQSPQATEAAIQNLTDRLGDWWRKEGFGLVSDVSFSAYGCKLNFSCSLYGDFHIINSPTPVSDKERKQLWHESLRERGFLLIQDEREWKIWDCDASRKALVGFLKERLPSLQISGFTNYGIRKSTEFALRSIEGTLIDLADIQRLAA
jgi:hypothetical protein